MKKTLNGFTLLELLITMAIVAVLAAIATPSFRQMIANSRSGTVGQELVDAINLARAEAIKRGKRVSVCASSDGVTCTGAWNAGWIVFADGAASDTATPIVSSRIQRYQGNSAASIAVLKNVTAQTYIRFTSQGLLARGITDANPISATVQYSGCSGNAARRIEIGIAGRISLSRQNCT